MMALKLITNQKAIVCKAKKSIAAFKIRKGFLVGTKITLRNETIYNFLDLFIFLIVPNMKNRRLFKLNNVCSLSIGLKDLFAFPQLNDFYDKFPKNMTGILNISFDKQNLI